MSGGVLAVRANAAASDLVNRLRRWVVLLRGIVTAGSQLMLPEARELRILELALLPQRGPQMRLGLVPRPVMQARAAPQRETFILTGKSWGAG
ncbi:MAG: hypothetical protein ACU0B1_10550 [Thermohalobaculum sp.]